MKLRFLISHHRKNSLRDKEIGKKWIYLERNTFHRQGLWALSKSESGPKTRIISLFGCGRRLLRGPWTAKRSNQSILKEINPEYSLEGLMLKLKLQYFGHLCEEPIHWKRPWEIVKGSLAFCSSWGRKELDLTMTEQQQKSHRLMRGRSFLAISGKGWGFLGIVVLPTFWILWSALKTVRVPVGMSFSLLMCYNEQATKAQGLVEVDLSAILDLFCSN